jgi:phage gp45-like
MRGNENRRSFDLVVRKEPAVEKSRTGFAPGDAKLYSHPGRKQMTMRHTITIECNCEPLPGCDNGKWIFESIFAALKSKTVAQAA